MYGNLKWWQQGVIYQVYPRSFQDTNQDGIGDLKGISQRLPYLKWLGVTAIWISPVYPSPMKDFGYDISDYENIDPVFGSLADMKDLIKETHTLGLQIILDLVPNHSSNQHPWFLESRSSRENPKRDWYIWKDALPEGKPPNNWLSVFGGSGWEWDDLTQQYYYHAFLKEQPDLNWRNEEVKDAMFGTIRFWLNKGIDGFRIDVMWHMIKDEQFRNNPPNPDYNITMPDYEQLLPVYSTDQPEVHDIVGQMRKILDAYDNRMMIGEIYLPIHKLVTYYGKENNGAHLPFNFMMISLPWDARQIASAIDEYEGALPKEAWPYWVLGNHEQPRITSRIGIEQSRIAAMLLLTLRGTPTIYYGEEIGMRDVPIPIEEVIDPQGLNMPGKNLSRDPARTPMLWDGSMHAGFSNVKPWLRIDRRYEKENVTAQQNDPDSMLLLYQRLLLLRNNEPSLFSGQYTRLHSDHQMIIFKREAEESDGFLIALNLTHRPCYFSSRELKISGIIEIASFSELEGGEILSEINLGGDEGIIVRLNDRKII
ncbi:MAG: alpha-amylase family glycosyl hydrolase [Bacteroidota bacterium]|nr:alpha-amylase family glycosyl hydrolase [Bacteroidota bacterium]